MKQYIKYLLVALPIWLLSFFWEGNIFLVEYRSDHLPMYVFCRIMQLIFLAWMIHFVCRATDKVSTEYACICWGGVCFVLLSTSKLILGPWPLEGDELNIFNAAIEYKYLFTYITGVFYIVSLMIIPAMQGVVIFKYLLLSLAIGYMSYRVARIWGKQLGILVNVFFLLPASFLSISLSVHRIPLTVIIFIVLFTKLICDAKEEKQFTLADWVFMCISIALMTWWRVEGMYFIILGPLLLCIAYRIKGKKCLICCLSIWLMQVVVAIPQISAYGSRSLGPFYASVVTTMRYEGVYDVEDEDCWDAIGAYLDLNKMDKINTELQDATYDDAYILFDNVGVKSNDKMVYQSYVSAVQKLILKHPETFLKTRIKAFHWCSFGATRNLNWKGRIVRGMSIITGILYIPLVVLLLVWFYALKKKQWLHWAVSSCGLCHFGIVFLLMPAAYFKYFYFMYVMGCMYFIFILYRIYLVKKLKKESHVKS